MFFWCFFFNKLRLIYLCSLLICPAYQLLKTTPYSLFSTFFFLNKKFLSHCTILSKSWSKLCCKNISPVTLILLHLSQMTLSHLCFQWSTSQDGSHQRDLSLPSESLMMINDKVSSALETGSQPVDLL